LSGIDLINIIVIDLLIQTGKNIKVANDLEMSVVRGVKAKRTKADNYGESDSNKDFE